MVIITVIHYITWFSCLGAQTAASHRTRDVEPMLFQCWPTVCDAGPTLNQHWTILCLLVWWVASPTAQTGVWWNSAITLYLPRLTHSHGLALELGNIADVFCKLVDSVRWDRQFYKMCEGNPIRMINSPIKTGAWIPVLRHCLNEM